MADTVRVAIVGAGYIGSIHAKTIARIQEEHPQLASLEYIVDVDLARAKRLASLYGTRHAGSVNELSGKVDLAIVATPTHTHRRIVEDLYRAGVSGMLVEKPLAGNLRDAAAIVDIAEHAWISVGHSERFNPAMDALGKVYTLAGLDDMILVSVETRRVGPFVERARGVDVVHDLATHDIDIILSIVGEAPGRVYATIRHGIVSQLPDQAHIIMEFESATASTTVSRVSPIKERRALVTFHDGRDHALLELDFIARDAKLYTSNGIMKPGVELEQPIYREDLEVIQRLRINREPPVSVYESFTVLQVCDMALKAGRESRLVDTKEYARYQGILERGIEGYREFKARLTSSRGAQT